MTTEQEFALASEMINNCNATLSCGCRYELSDAMTLYRRCKKYIELYEEKSLV